MTLKFDSHAVHINYPNCGEYVDAPFNGTDTVVHGPHVADGFTDSVLFAGRREIIEVTKRNGKTITQGFLELSKDGRFITDSWWNPGEPAVKDILVYEKK
jgi:hypothetical protein